MGIKMNDTTAKTLEDLTDEEKKVVLKMLKKTRIQRLFDYIYDVWGEAIERQYKMNKNKPPENVFIGSSKMNEIRKTLLAPQESGKHFSFDFIADVLNLIVQLEVNVKLEKMRKDYLRECIINDGVNSDKVTDDELDRLIEG